MPSSPRDPAGSRQSRGGSHINGAPTSPTGMPRQRLPRDERERIIVQEAIRFFAEVGFEGQTRELARRIGITQPLIFRYFPTKDDLIERVYQEVYLSRWKPEWQLLLEDRGRPLNERLAGFYLDYTDTIFSYEWVRIFMYSGLKGVNINRRYLGLVQDRLLTPMCRELRAHCGYDATDPGMEEMEFVWGLHGSVFYLAIRKWIYGVETPADLSQAIRQKIIVFMDGGPHLLHQLLGPPPMAAAGAAAAVAPTSRPRAHKNPLSSDS